MLKGAKWRELMPPAIFRVFSKVIPHTDPARMHSLGMGFTVKEGVEVIVSEHHETEVLFNGECINFPTVRAVVNRLTHNSGITGIKVEITSPLPLGCGFGLSGAAALATAYALNETLDLAQKQREARDDSAYCRS